MNWTMPSKELSGSAKVTAFSFMRRRREKGIAGKGMRGLFRNSGSIRVKHHWIVDHPADPFAPFLCKLGMQDDSGSPRGDRTRLRNQMDRFFSATVSLIYKAKKEIESGHYSFAVDSETEGGG